MGSKVVPTKQLRGRLSRAVQRGDLKRTRDYLEAFDVDDDKIYTRSMTAKRAKFQPLTKQQQYDLLSFAISKRHLKVVKELIHKGFCLNFEDLASVEVPLLQKAVETGDKDLVEILLINGADVNAGSNEPLETDFLSCKPLPFQRGTTALHRAAAQNHLKIVQLLLDHAASVSASDQFSVTAMHHAAQRGYSPIVELLFEKGALIDQTDGYRTTPVGYAAEKGHKEVFAFLLDRVTRNIRVTMRRSLDFAAQAGQVEIIKILLDRGIPINTKCSLQQGRTSLHQAAYNGQSKVVRFLLDQGGDVSILDRCGETAFHRAAASVQIEMAEVLLSVNIKQVVSKYRETRGIPDISLLLETAESGGVESLQLLLDQGADIHAKDFNGRTALNIAIGLRLFYIAKFLIKQMVRMHFDNLDVCAQDFALVNDVDVLKTFLEECKKEMSVISQDFIEDTCVRYCDIINSQSLSQVVSYVRNENIVQALDSQLLKSKFPIYASMLDATFEKAVVRKKMQDKARRVFCSLYDKNDEKLPELAENFTDDLFSYLSLDDLANLTL